LLRIEHQLILIHVTEQHPQNLDANHLLLSTMLKNVSLRSLTVLDHILKPF
jgi:hypothetical protein